MTSYTDADAIAAYLGRELTAEQAEQADLAAAAVTAWIDRRTGRTWQIGAAVTDELQHVLSTNDGSIVYVNARPVVSIQSVDVREPRCSTWTALDESGYALMDAATGRLMLDGQVANAEARVDYTWAASGAPDDLAHAATVIASEMLGSTLNPDLAGVESLALGQNDISIKFGAGAAGGSTSDAAWSALAVVDSYRRPVLA